VSTWVRTTGTGKFAAVFGKRDSWWCGFADTTGKPRLDPDDTATVKVVANTAVDDGNWHHVAYRVSEGENRIEIYIDGSLSNGKDAFSSSATSDDAGIASKGGTKDYYNGELAEVRWYNRALNSSEISTLASQ
jgi:hypothetical protein